VTQISERTVQLTDEYLARANPPAALRRLLSEGQDSVRRALRGQRVDRTEG
jgi:aminopeptidase N